MNERELLMEVERAARRLSRDVVSFLMFPRDCDENRLNASRATLDMHVRQLDEWRIKRETEIGQRLAEAEA
jgi:hypothetical protein